MKTRGTSPNGMLVDELEEKHLPGTNNDGMNRHERRALAKLQRIDEKLNRKIKQLESTLTKRNVS